MKINWPYAPKCLHCPTNSLVESFLHCVPIGPLKGYGVAIFIKVIEKPIASEILTQPSPYKKAVCQQPKRLSTTWVRHLS